MRASTSSGLAKRRSEPPIKQPVERRNELSIPAWSPHVVVFLTGCLADSETGLVKPGLGLPIGLLLALARVQSSKIC